MDSWAVSAFWLLSIMMLWTCVYTYMFEYLFSNLLKKLINFREREEGGRERDTLIYYSTYLCIHWLLLVCALTRDWIRNLGLLGWCFNQLSYLYRAFNSFGHIQGVELLGHMVILCLSFWGTSKLFSSVVEPFYTPPSDIYMRGPIFLYSQ